MAELALNGDLTFYLNAFVESFEGGIARGVGTSISASSGAPFASSLSGFGLFHPTDGSGFLNGTVTGVKLAHLQLGPLVVTDHVEITGLSILADDLFTLVDQTATTISGRFDADAFASALAPLSFSVTGSDGNDSASPNDWVTFAGDDSFALGAGDDKLNAGAGNDTVAGGLGGDTLFGGSGKDKINGNAGKDTLRGEAGSDVLRGGGGADKIFGNGGNDRLFGDGGKNVLIGGKGKDSFIFNGAGRDTGCDFTDDVDKRLLHFRLWSRNCSVNDLLNYFGNIPNFGAGLCFCIAVVFLTQVLLCGLVLQV
ncbi:MAG: calcium-binding protein [Arenibacterium sp.]